MHLKNCFCFPCISPQPNAKSLSQTFSKHIELSCYGPENIRVMDLSINLDQGHLCEYLLGLTVAICVDLINEILRIIREYVEPTNFLQYNSGLMDL